MRRHRLVPGRRSSSGQTDPSSPLIQLVRDELAAASSSGRALFLQMPSGTNALLEEILIAARRSDRRVRVAVASAADPATPAWRQIAIRLTGRHRAVAALRRSLEAWVGVVPLVGPLISAVMNTLAELTHNSLPATAAAGTGSSVDDVRRILGHGRNELRLIVLTDCETADAAELAGAFALIQQLRTTRTLLLVMANMTGGRSAKGFADLLWEAERLGVGRRALGEAGLHPDEVELVRCAAGLGECFEVAHLVHLLGTSEAQIESQLAALVRANIVTLHDTIERDGDLVDVYAFVDPMDLNRWRAGTPWRAQPAGAAEP